MLGAPTMSSREIAELVESRHDKVKQSIERLAARGVIALPPLGEYLDSLGRRAAEYRVVKRDSYVIVAQLSPEFTARLVDRWQELESRATQPAVNLDDPAFLRGALLQYTERVIALEQKVAEQAPAVEFAHAIRDTNDAISIGQMSAVLGIGRNRFFARLRADHILMADNLPYQTYKDRGYFRVIESVWIDDAKEPHPTFKTLVTGRGQVFLQRKYGAEAA
ncbi:phage antirepressor KilAC domain-containing protein [Caballeronia sp. LZ062]|uniref:phage antirepressor KilAC domain-containing protein n=1 Tax=unclassified Caballeronia TaxID=2646786 RepID=UPI00285F80E3|nr:MULTISPECIES: phage antirepressor KilAC domain-containing protein [unclassified Caballeronia]MDR5856629.1 phage antirepressor KilAC domain-containing protein [Caballeronia sp. LZ050]MDR5868785.1 phage antirepressor KilAC domain-containing protein [Caballeronia sp. LZ062]